MFCAFFTIADLERELNMSGGNFQPAKLDVESSILDSNLKIITDSDPLDSLFPGLNQPKKKVLDSLVPQAEYETTKVVPKPGLCVKTKNAGGSKFFINICKLTEIPPPPPIDESELAKMIESEDYSNLWRYGLHDMIMVIRAEN